MLFDSEPAMITAQSSYPAEAIELWSTPRGTPLLIRPIVPDDRLLLGEFFAALSIASCRARFHGAVRELPARMLARLCTVDYGSEMALVATIFSGGYERIVGEARYATTGRADQAEFAICVSDGAQERGLGTQMLKRLMQYAAGRRIARLHGDVHVDNRAMLKLARRTGFRIFEHPADPTLVRVERTFQS